MRAESHFRAAHERTRNSGRAEPEQVRVPKVERTEIRRPRIPRSESPRPPKMMAEPKSPKATRQYGAGVPRALRGKIALPQGDPSDAEYP